MPLSTGIVSSTAWADRMFPLRTSSVMCLSRSTIFRLLNLSLIHILFVHADICCEILYDIFLSHCPTFMNPVVASNVTQLFRNSRSMQPVSYTHLCDNGNGKRLAKAKNDPAGTYREYLSDIRRQKRLSIKAVSYTHLDVYKRQRP